VVCWDTPVSCLKTAYYFFVPETLAYIICPLCKKQAGISILACAASSADDRVQQKAAGTDGLFHAHLAYPYPRKRKATRACEEGRVGGSHQSFERSVQDVYGERCIASILVLTGFLDGPNARWLETLGPASTDVKARDTCNHRCWQTLSTRVSRDEQDAWSTSHLLSAGNAGSPKQGAIPAW
jgi:hypothetical protein